MKFNIITFGCKVNTYESEYMKEQLLKNSFIYDEDFKTSDIVIINTCSVTNTADNKSCKMIRSVRKNNPQAILVVCGCTAENKRDSLKDLDIDILIGNKDKSKIVTSINDFISNRKPYCKFYEERNSVFESMTINDFNLTRAFVKIQDGCNNFCAYCIIPYLRGNIRSKDIDEAYEEILNLVKKGHKEIVFTGINTGAYGKETGRFDLVDLIEKVSKIPTLERIRISSIEITEITDRVINELKNNFKLCGHFHVSLQSGSNHVLKQMNRKYTKEEYLSIIKKLKQARPTLNLTTDVIVGFPGETDEDFQECLEFCQEVGFSKIHVFPFSKRTGTKAAIMVNQIPDNIKKIRAHQLIEYDKKLQLAFHKQFLNTEVEVLIETVDDNKSTGHTENFIKVEIAEKLIPNNNYKVKIIEAFFDKVIAIRLK